jgi:hypothetical protein
MHITRLLLIVASGFLSTTFALPAVTFAPMPLPTATKFQILIINPGGGQTPSLKIRPGTVGLNLRPGTIIRWHPDTTPSEFTELLDSDEEDWTHWQIISPDGVAHEDSDVENRFQGRRTNMRIFEIKKVQNPAVYRAECWHWSRPTDRQNVVVEVVVDSTRLY